MTWAATEGRTAVDLRADAAQLARFSGKPRDMLYELARKGRVHRVQAGRYLISEKPSKRPRVDALDSAGRGRVAQALPRVVPILALRALWHYGLIDQQAFLSLYVAVTARKAPRSRRT